MASAASSRSTAWPTPTPVASASRCAGERWPVENQAWDSAIRREHSTVPAAPRRCMRAKAPISSSDSLAPSASGSSSASTSSNPATSSPTRRPIIRSILPLPCDTYGSIPMTSGQEFRSTCWTGFGFQGGDYPRRGDDDAAGEDCEFSLRSETAPVPDHPRQDCRLHRRAARSRTPVDNAPTRPMLRRSEKRGEPIRLNTGSTVPENQQAGDDVVVRSTLDRSNC